LKGLYYDARSEKHQISVSSWFYYKVKRLCLGRNKIEYKTAAVPISTEVAEEIRC